MHHVPNEASSPPPLDSQQKHCALKHLSDRAPLICARLISPRPVSEDDLTGVAIRADRVTPAPRDRDPPARSAARQRRYFSRTAGRAGRSSRSRVVSGGNAIKGRLVNRRLVACSQGKCRDSD